MERVSSTAAAKNLRGKRKGMPVLWGMVLVCGIFFIPLSGQCADVESPVVLALKYAEMKMFPNYMTFFMGDPPYTNQPPLHYFMYYWLIKTKDRNILVDVGTGPSYAKRYPNYQPPDVMLAKVGLKPSDIDTIIISHPHFDHIDAMDFFKTAKAYVQRAAYRYAVEEYPEFKPFRKNKKDVITLVDLMWADRLKLLDGDVELFPGIKLIKVDGHYPGQQIVVVETGGKPVILASDAVHVYENIEQDKAMGVFFGTVTDVVKAYETIRRLNGIIVPGHDKKVFERGFKKIDESILQIYP